MPAPFSSVETSSDILPDITNVKPSVEGLKQTAQGAVEPFTLVEGPQSWHSKQYKDSTSWIHYFTPEQIAEIEAAVDTVIQSGLVSVDGNYVTKIRESVTKATFPLPTLAPFLEDTLNEVTRGRGFALLKGLPVDRWTRLQSLVAYWGLGLYWGSAVSQNAKGHLLGHVKDTGYDSDQKIPTTRIYLTRVAQPWHCDSVDVVGLLCLKTAKEGGLSSFASSHAAHNELLKRRPDLVKALAGDWFLDRKNEVPEGKLPYYNLPIVNYFEKHLSVFLNDTYYQLAQRHAEVPRLTAEQIEALDAFKSLLASDELRLDFWLEPGDVQLVNNHTIVHTRSGYVDHEETEKKRHLLRLWLAPPAPHAWPLPPAYAELFDTTEIGVRGGIHVPGWKETIPVEAE